MSKVNFNSTFDYKLIYIFRINDKKHAKMLKIGDATIHTNKSIEELKPGCHDLNCAARERIDDYTSTAGVSYELLHTELAVFHDASHENKLRFFRDHKVHDVLLRSGVKRKYFDTNRKQNEWFITDLSTAQKAIAAVKSNRGSLTATEVTTGIDPIIFRPEQDKAIKQTLTQFKKHNKMLWNAKMRFGKTLCALQVVKESEFAKTLIITHRPVVSESWFKDFKKIFYDRKDYLFGSKNDGENITNLLSGKKKFVYFASIQDLRGSKTVGGEFDKNSEIFSTDWDFIVIDEAHEGTQTKLGQSVIEELVKNCKKNHTTKELYLSGTPFNLLSSYDEDSIYTWDYIMEQEEKQNWYKDPKHFGDYNPYEELPKMNIFTYHLERYLTGFMDVDDKAFNFKEFFRTWTGDVKIDGARMPAGVKVGEFVHEKDIQSFLNLISREDPNTNYPFSTPEYRNFFRHTLWVVPGVKEAKALSDLLHSHSVFGSGVFKIVNVAGDGDEEIDTGDALKAVQDAFGEHPEETYSITLSCGRLTTGVTVPEWTAVLMLAGSYSTAAAQYLQTIFRVQSPANIGGKIKTNCYVFDFAPDRTLKMIAEAVQYSSKGTGGNSGAETRLGAFLNFCPIIAVDNSNMKEFKTEALLQELKKAYVERVVRNGFDDVKLYNDNLLKLDGLELEEFAKLKKIIGSSKAQEKTKDIDINKEGFSKEEYEKIQKALKKKKKELTPEEKKLLEELKKKRKNKANAISILRGISIRMPLLVYGANCALAEDITVDNFVDQIDDLSWQEFMPTGVTKETFKKFSKYYDKDVFVAAGRRIRHICKNADELEPTERTQKIAQLFSTFKNPDKETVLTPWNVVNMHISECFGGYDFFDESHNKLLEAPRYTEPHQEAKDVLIGDSKVLEINAKTGLYPLYVAYSLYRERLDQIPEQERTFEKKYKIWDTVIADNVFAICKTPMAKSITKRTLVGYRDVKINAHCFEDLIMQFKDKTDKLLDKINKTSFWNKKGADKMNFAACVGNPPYQDGHHQIYPYFYLAAQKLGKCVSLIFPKGWQEPKDSNNLKMLNNKDVKSDEQIVFVDNRHNVFPGISGAEWTNIILWKKDYDNGLNGKQLIYTDGKNPEEVELLTDKQDIKKPKEIDSIVNKVNKLNEQKIISLVSARKPYGFEADPLDNPNKYGLVVKDKATQSTVRLFGKKDGEGRAFINIEKSGLPKSSPLLDCWKLFVVKAWGNMDEKRGFLGGSYSDLLIAHPGDCCSEMYLEVGPFANKKIAENAKKYFYTKFFRAVFYKNKMSQNTARETYQSVPMQDFTDKSDIDWSKSVAEIDKQLYKKYGLDKKEIEFVEAKIKTIKPME
ncbi:MAG: DEAD/DEAH box helicase family protein [Alphaproteobacteria bacterium]|nr:DEAD/DEAH box helicase family protein [Alphaproteobacteria bacterium]